MRKQRYSPQNFAKNIDGSRNIYLLYDDNSRFLRRRLSYWRGKNIRDAGQVFHTVHTHFPDVALQRFIRLSEMGEMGQFNHSCIYFYYIDLHDYFH
jgi:hypothetical protein